jgi:hypothetical protein
VTGLVFPSPRVSPIAGLANALTRYAIRRYRAEEAALEAALILATATNQHLKEGKP